MLWLTMHIGVIAGLPSRMESLELRMTKLEESLRKFITAVSKLTDITDNSSLSSVN